MLQLTSRDLLNWRTSLTNENSSMVFWGWRSILFWSHRVWNRKRWSRWCRRTGWITVHSTRGQLITIRCTMRCTDRHGVSVENATWYCRATTIGISNTLYSTCVKKNGYVKNTHVYFIFTWTYLNYTMKGCVVWKHDTVEVAEKDFVIF